VPPKATIHTGKTVTRLITARIIAPRQISSHATESL
jgi:hypothetical protein